MSGPKGPRFCARALRRRSILGGGLVFSLMPGMALAAPKSLNFAVFRNGSKIGEHHIVFRSDGPQLTATTDAIMLVKLGPVPVFRYHHHAIETRNDGAFQRLETATLTNGKAEHVAAEKTADGVIVERPAGRAILPGDINPLTHWNSRIFSGPLFNPQTGQILRVRTSRVASNQFSIRGEVEMDDFYDETGAWSAARAKADDESMVEYQRQ